MVNRVSPKLARVTVRMRHPMDTGFAFGHPAFFMNQIDIRDKDEQLLSSIEMSEPVSENPTLTIEPRMQGGAQQLLVDARDNDGNEFGYSVPVPAAQLD
jgi:sulfur-oxidizing protein SoxY